jgi:hypothetical protein
MELGESTCVRPSVASIEWVNNPGRPIGPRSILRTRGGKGARSFDEFELAIIPIVLGRGLPIFSELTQPQRLTLISSKAFPKGTVVQVYRPAECTL